MGHAQALSSQGHNTGSVPGGNSSTLASRCTARTRCSQRKPARSWGAPRKASLRVRAPRAAARPAQARRRAQVVWLQSYISEPRFEEALARAGIRVVPDRCLKADRARALSRL